MTDTDQFTEDSMMEDDVFKQAYMGAVPMPEITDSDDIRSICMHCKVHMKGDPKAKLISHGLCGDCEKEHYPDLYKKRKE